jgi:D-arabinose 1-dehydrogenase-like Zn-dependent alcohol dehydrogenase
MTDIPKTALAGVFVKANEPFEMRELDVTQPGAGEVLIEVLRTNICGSDVHMFTGDAFAGFGGVPFPMILGHEIMGRVAALGEHVDKDTTGAELSVGDRVTFAYYRGCKSCVLCTRGDEHACLLSLMSVIRPVDEAPHWVGGFAQYYMLRKGQAIYRLPDEVPNDLAAGINCALAQVIHGLAVAGLKRGESIAIQGAGGLGLYATAVAKSMGASKVIVIDGVPGRLDLAKKLGADVTVCIDEHPDAKQRTKAVKEASGGGVDVVVEVVGKADALREGVRMLARAGRYLVMGAVVPKQHVKLDPSMWVGQNLRLLGVSLYPHAALAGAIAFIAKHGQQLPLGAMVESYPLSKIDEAMQAACEKKRAGRVQLNMESS